MLLSTRCEPVAGGNASPTPPLYSMFILPPLPLGGVLTTSSQSWANARQHCQAAGGDLASLPSMDKFDAFWNFFLRPGWLGASDLNAEGSFTWVDGRPVLNLWDVNEVCYAMACALLFSCCCCHVHPFQMLAACSVNCIIYRLPSSSVVPTSPTAEPAKTAWSCIILANSMMSRATANGRFSASTVLRLQRCISSCSRRAATLCLGRAFSLVSVTQRCV